MEANVEEEVDEGETEFHAEEIRHVHSSPAEETNNSAGKAQPNCWKYILWKAQAP